MTIRFLNHQRIGMTAPLVAEPALCPKTRICGHSIGYLEQNNSLSVQVVTLLRTTNGVAMTGGN